MAQLNRHLHLKDIEDEVHIIETVATNRPRPLWYENSFRQQLQVVQNPSIICWTEKDEVSLAPIPIPSNRINCYQRHPVNRQSPVLSTSNLQSLAKPSNNSSSSQDLTAVPTSPASPLRHCLHFRLLRLNLSTRRPVLVDVVITQQPLQVITTAAVEVYLDAPPIGIQNVNSFLLLVQ